MGCGLLVGSCEARLSCAADHDCWEKESREASPAVLNVSNGVGNKIFFLKESSVGPLVPEVQAVWPEIAASS